MRDVFYFHDLVAVQPPPCCSFARHLAGKMVIYCSFAHHQWCCLSFETIASSNLAPSFTICFLGYHLRVPCLMPSIRFPRYLLPPNTWTGSQHLIIFWPYSILLSPPSNGSAPYYCNTCAGWKTIPFWGGEDQECACVCTCIF